MTDQGFLEHCRRYIDQERRLCSVITPDGARHLAAYLYFDMQRMGVTGSVAKAYQPLSVEIYIAFFTRNTGPGICHVIDSMTGAERSFEW